MASPTVLMLASSSSGMATPNLSSTAVAISTIDSESTSRSSVKDFSGVASAGVTPATSSRISARPDWMFSRLTLGSSLFGALHEGGGSADCRDGRPGDQDSGQAQNLPGEGQPGAEHQRQVAGLRLTRLQQCGERQRNRGGRG